MVHYVLAEGLGWKDLLVILLVVLILFGSTKVPEMMRNLGRGIGEFKKGMKEDGSEGETKSTSSPEQKPEEKKP